MKKFEAKALDPKNGQTYLDWLNAASDINLVDWETLEYSSALHIEVDADDEPVLITTVHPVLVIEALAPKPGVDPRVEAIALKKLYETAKTLCDKFGLAEIHFQCEDPTLAKFILGRGFVKSTPTMFKLRMTTDPLRVKNRNYGSPL
jgi:hypothetical protein